MNDRRHDTGSDRDRDVASDIDVVEEDIAEHDPDPVTRRESLEQELMEERRSEEGEEIELEDDLAEHDGSGVAARRERDT